MSYTYEIVLNGKKPLIREFLNGKKCVGWELQHIKNLLESEIDSVHQNSFKRCRNWVKEKHPEFFL